MQFSKHLKKILLAAIVVLIGGDVTLLFAAPADNATQNNPQVQQVQAQIQAQIKALQDQAASSSSSAVPTPAAAALAAQQASSSVGGNSAVSGGMLSQVVSPDTVQAQINAGSAVAQKALDMANAVGSPGNANAQGSDSVQVSSSDIDQSAFHAMVQNALPMTPDQIQKLRSVYMASQYAAASSPTTPPQPTATSEFVDLSPGSTPPVVRLSQGFVTSMVFVDSTGAPWPIEAYDVGNPSAFNIQWDKKSNTLMVQSTVLYNYGNLAVKLQGLDTPVMITLIPGQKIVDYRVDMRVPGMGPNARPLLNNSLPNGTSSDLLNVLDGIAPNGATVLTVEGGDCQAWLSNNTLYVRTRLNVISPGWTATLSSADGMHAYQMQPTPMILVSQNGQVVQLKVKGL